MTFSNCVTLNLDSLFSTWRCTKEHTKKGMMIKLILRQPWLKFFRSLSVILPIRELGLRHDFEIYNHSSRQGFPGPDRNHLRRHYLQRGHHYHNHNYCSALYLQLLGWQRRCGGFLYRHGSRLLLIPLRFRYSKIISTDCFHGIVRPNETNATFFLQEPFYSLPCYTTCWDVALRECAAVRNHVTSWNVAEATRDHGKFTATFC